MKSLLLLFSTSLFCLLLGVNLYGQNKYLLDRYAFKIYGGDRENFEILYQGKLDSVSSSGILFNDVNSINLTDIFKIRISNEKRPSGIGIITGATGGLLGGIIAGFIGGLDFKPCPSGSFSCLKFTPIDTGLLGGISGALIGGILLQRNRTLNISGSQYRYNKKFYRRKKWFRK